MNRSIFDYNGVSNDLPYQKLEPNFSYDIIDLESNLEKTDPTSFAKKSLLNRIIKDIDSDRVIKTKPENFQTKYDSIYGINHNYHFNATSENNISYAGEEFAENLEKNRKIFKIEKINKKIGRIKKDSLVKGFHNKFSQDNIIRKIKARFMENIRLYLNEEYKIYLLKKTENKKKIVNWLKKIDPHVSRKIKKEENLKWFETKVYEIFSENVSLRYSKNTPDLNRKKIARLMKLNEAVKVIDILNTKVEILFDKYINDEKVGGFKTLENDIEEIKTFMEKRNQENVKEYLKKYKYVAKNMKKIFIQKNARNNKSK